MNPEELKDFEPSWKGMAPLPVPLAASDGASGYVDSAAVDSASAVEHPEAETADLPEFPVPDFDDFASEEPFDSSSPFSLKAITEDAAGIKVTINRGTVRELVASAASTSTVWPIEESEYTVKSGESLWVNFTTDKKGQLIKAPTLEPASGDKATVHYQPVDAKGAEGVEGDYWIKIGTFEGSEAARENWTPGHNSDIEHYAQLFTGTVRSGAAIYKKRDPIQDEYLFRGVQGGYGVSEVENEDTVDLSVDFENVGEGSPVWVSEDGEGGAVGGAGPAQFRSIAPYGQIDVTTEGNTIRISGNGISDSLYAPDGTLMLEWEDGLITKGGGTLQKAVPDGVNVGDMLIWDGVNWSILPAYQGSQAVLSMSGGVAKWLETEECP